jgi:imidazole glycerol-phosphate synthase subunit HisH
MIIIVDYKVGNLGSIYNMLKKIGVSSEITSDKEKISLASKLILPGVGSFDTGMRNLKEMGLVEILCEKVLKQKVPVLGICLGMQLLTLKSEEGILPGLGWVNGSAKKFLFDKDSSLKVPHMGWNYVDQQKNSNLFLEMYNEARFYFVHSYYVDLDNKDDILTKTSHGNEFCSSLEKGNVFGVQFHPEKSHKYGMKLLKNFSENC